MDRLSYMQVSGTEQMAHRQPIDLCLASQHFFPTHGGAQLRFLRYLPGLHARGVATRVLSGTPKSKKIIDADASHLDNGPGQAAQQSAEPIEGIRIHRVKLPDRAGWQRSIAFNQSLWRFCTGSDYRPDVIQVVSSLQPRSLPWVLQLRRRGIPIVYAYTIPATLPTNPIRRRYRRWALRMLYRHVDCMVVGTAEMRDLALDIGVATRFEVIPNGVNLQRFRPAQDLSERQALRSSLGVGEQERMITLVGAVHPRKGTDVLLEAWRRVLVEYPQTHVFLVGLRKDQKYPKLNAFREKLQDIIAAAGAADRVHFTGTVRNPETYLRAADVFVFPSQREGLPNAVLEAMASGVPAILTPFIGLSEDLGKADSEYLLCERSPEALARCMAELFANPKRADQLGRAGRRWVEQTMDLEKSLDRYAAMYQELAAGARPRRPVR